MTSSGWGGGGRGGSQVKNDKNSDGSRWLQGGGRTGRRSTEIGCPEL